MTVARGRARAHARFFAFLLPSLALATPAFAEEADVAAAETLFRDGRARMEAKDYAHACPKLEASYRIDPATGTLLALALCYEASGKTASAWTSYAEAAARAKREGRADREKAARQRAAALEAKLSKINVSLSPDAEKTPGLAVQRDGVALDSAALGTAIPVDPGEHTIRAAAPGKLAWSTTVTIGVGTKAIVIPAL